MREILFRGFDTNKKTWRYGYVFLTRDGGVEHAQIWDKEKDKPFSVDPKSIGQFLGIEDDKMNKIFEGDIVERMDSDPKERIYIYDMNNFMQSLGIAVREFAENWIDLNILGNIYENPDLLQVINKE